MQTAGISSQVNDTPGAGSYSPEIARDGSRDIMSSPNFCRSSSYASASPRFKVCLFTSKYTRLAHRSTLSPPWASDPCPTPVVGMTMVANAWHSALQFLFSSSGGADGAESLAGPGCVWPAVIEPAAPLVHVVPETTPPLSVVVQGLSIFVNALCELSPLCPGPWRV